MVEICASHLWRYLLTTSSIQTHSFDRSKQIQCDTRESNEISSWLNPWYSTGKLEERIDYILDGNWSRKLLFISAALACSRIIYFHFWLKNLQTSEHSTEIIQGKISLSFGRNIVPLKRFAGIKFSCHFISHYPAGNPLGMHFFLPHNSEKISK